MKRATRREGLNRATRGGGAKRTSRRGGAGWLLAFLLAGQAAPPAAGQCHYEVTWVGPYAGFYGVPTGMNNRGQIVGYFTVSDEAERGFVWSQEDGLTVLPNPPGDIRSRPNGINDSGLIVGVIGGVFTPFRAFLWEGEEYIDLGIPAGGTYSEASAINERGQVVGVWGNNISGPNHGFLWEDGVMTDLGPLLGTENSSAADITEDGGIAGWIGEAPTTEAQAYILEQAFAYTLGPIPDCSTSEARGINRTLSIAGRGANRDADKRLFSRAFTWLDGQFHVLQPSAEFRSSVAVDINDRRAVVGYSFTTSAKGFTWRDGAQTDLSTLVPEGHTVQVVAAIDDHGRIAASVHAPPLGRGAALLTPITTPADLNIDCRVDLQDLLLLLVDFGCVERDCDGDVDGDGQTALPDLAILLASWSP